VFADAAEHGGEAAGGEFPVERPGGLVVALDEPFQAALSEPAPPLARRVLADAQSRAIRALERPIAAASTICARSRSRQEVLAPRMRFFSALRPLAVKVTGTAGSGMRGLPGTITLVQSTRAVIVPSRQSCHAAQ
jgi:hypothetical protein